MKHRLLTTLTAALLALSAWATEIDGIYYDLDSSTKTAEVISRGSYKGDITIPSSVTYKGETYSVTSIGYGAFYNCTGLTSINIPASVTNIGADAFRGCTGLTSITIPNSVTSIGYLAFNGCTGLTNIKVEAGNTKYDSRDNCNAIIETASNTLVVGCKATTIPSSVTSIGDQAFRDCTGLTSITIPSSVTSIGDFAFYGCTSLTSINIPNSVTSIEEYAFYGCTGLTSVTIGNSVTSIEGSAFERCTGLTSIYIPSSVTSIGQEAFKDCTGLTSIYIPNSVTYIRGWAFSGCTGLTSITIPNSVTSIEKSVFRGCTGLTSITIPNSVTSIGSYAFSGCTGLTSITIPSSVTSIGSEAFYRCTGLTSITALRTDPEAYNCERDAFNNVPTSTCTLHVSKGSKEAYKAIKPWSNFASIVDDIDTGSDDAVVLTADGEYAWTDGVLRFRVSSEENGEAAVSGVKNKDNLGAVTIPEKVKIADKVYSVTSIGFRAFYECSGLTSATIPNSVTRIGEGAFYGCTGLTSINIPASVTNIGADAFRGCTGLTSITIPSSVTSIGSGAFRGCTGLTSVTIPESVTSIGDEAFFDCSGLTSITIPKSVTSIGSYAFTGCKGLTSITIPNSVTSIGDWAFINCSGLTSIKVEAGNTKYDSRDNCNAIIETASNTLVAGCKATTIPNSVTRIGSEAFWGCTGLTSITIPSSVTSIRSGAFTWCSGLTSIKVEAGNTKYDSRDNCNAIIETASNTLVAGCKATSIPNSVTSIGSHAFWGCTGLTSITIPNSVTSIGERAFLVCTGLTDIYALRTDPAAYDCATNAFSDYSATLHVPADSKEAYASTEPWSNFANIVEEEDLTAIQSLTLTPSEAGESYYNLQGQRIAEPQRGQIVVVRRADGTSRKMYVR